MRIIVDADWLLYSAAAVCEERSIEALHIKSGKTKIFKNRTELFGSKQNELGGWLAAFNRENNTEFTREDFQIQDKQRISKGADYKKVLDGMLGSIKKKLNFNALGDSFDLYVGSGEVFRLHWSTLMEYKGNRKDLMKPLLIADCRQYLLDEHGATLVTGVETDDMVYMLGVQGYNTWKETGSYEDKTVVVSVDKDARAGPYWLYNPDKDEEPWLIEGLGELSLTKKGDVTGHGRLFLYFQVLSGDPIDNYKANCKSEIKWGPKSAYNALKDCKDDKECFEVLVSTYKFLYPEPKVVLGWRGNPIEIDWLYVLQECFDMARMLRSTEDIVYIGDILRSLNIPYEGMNE